MSKDIDKIIEEVVAKVLVRIKQNLIIKEEKNITEVKHDIKKR